MQITAINSLNNNVNYIKNRNRYVSFKAANSKELVSDTLMSKLKDSITRIIDFEYLNSDNKYIVPIISKKASHYSANARQDLVLVKDTKQLRELLGDKANGYQLSRLMGACVVAAEGPRDLDKCEIYETILCIVPNPTATPSLYEELKTFD